jgi:hypothetical protein
VPGQAVGYTQFVPSADYHVCRGGGRGLYGHVDVDVLVVQAVVQSPMPLNSSSCHDSLGVAARQPPVALHLP